MGQTAVRYILGGLGFILGTSIGLAIEFALLALVESMASRHYNPVGLGWVVLPISLGLGLARVGLAVDGATLILKVAGGAKPLKAYAAGCVAWFLGIVGWLAIAEPYRYRYRLRDEDWMFLAKLALVPPVLLFVAVCAGAWATTNVKRS
jgi:hypothetical protein